MEEGDQKGLAIALQTVRENKLSLVLHPSESNSGFKFLYAIVAKTSCLQNRISAQKIEYKITPLRVRIFIKS
jgi:hypothetical protein